MNVNEHPELEILNNYLKNSSAVEFDSLRLHLAQCSQCRALVDGLTGLKDISRLQVETNLTDEQFQQIEDYIHHRLNNSEHKKLKHLIDSDPAALKAALHIASHKSSLERTEPVNKLLTSSVDSKNKNVLHFFHRLKSIFTYQTPAWLSVPVTAAFIALLSFNLAEKQPTQPGHIIASYQDNAIIQFKSRDTLPGIGFFAKTETSSTSYNGLQVSISSNNAIELHWPAIENAIQYNLRLQMFEQGIKTPVANITTKKNSALVNTQLKNIYHRYEWVLSGETSDNRVFMANGGFVINQLHKGSLQ